jgi:hypothetical protein
MGRSACEELELIIFHTLLSDISCHDIGQHYRALSIHLAKSQFKSSSSQEYIVITDNNSAKMTGFCNPKVRSYLKVCRSVTYFVLTAIDH